MKSEAFCVRVEDLGVGFAIKCSGELDIATHNELRNAVDFCLEGDALFLHVDCRKVTFMASAGLDALLYALFRCRSRGTVFQVSLGSAGERLLQVLGCSDLEELDNLEKTRRGAWLHREIGGGSRTRGAGRQSACEGLPVAAPILLRNY